MTPYEQGYADAQLELLDLQLQTQRFLVQARRSQRLALVVIAVALTSGIINLVILIV